MSMHSPLESNLTNSNWKSIDPEDLAVNPNWEAPMEEQSSEDYKYYNVPRHFTFEPDEAETEWKTIDPEDLTLDPNWVPPKQVKPSFRLPGAEFKVEKLNYFENRVKKPYKSKYTLRMYTYK